MPNTKSNTCINCESTLIWDSALHVYICKNEKCAEEEWEKEWVKEFSKQYMPEEIARLEKDRNEHEYLRFRILRWFKENDDYLVTFIYGAFVIGFFAWGAYEYFFD